MSKVQDKSQKSPVHVPVTDNVTSESEKKDGKKKNVRKMRDLTRYIKLIFDQITASNPSYPKLSIKGDAKHNIDQHCDSFIKEVIIRMNNISSGSTKKTASKEIVICVIKDLLPKELCAKALAFCDQVYSKYIEVKKDKKDKKAEGIKGDTEHDGEKYGLILPLPRISRKVRKHSISERTSASVYYYTTATLQIVVTDLLEKTINQTLKDKKKMINPNHLTKAIALDDELYSLFKKLNVLMLGGLQNTRDILKLRIQFNERDEKKRIEKQEKKAASELKKQDTDKKVETPAVPVKAAVPKKVAPPPAVVKKSPKAVPVSKKKPVKNQEMASPKPKSVKN